jgi:hypothetical protein
MEPAGTVASTPVGTIRRLSFAVSDESGGAMKRLSLLIAFAIYEKAKPKITPAK